MGKYTWSVGIEGRQRSEVRHFNHVTKLYRWILRRGRWFDGQQLVIYESQKTHPMQSMRKPTVYTPIAKMTFEEVKERYTNRTTETEERGGLMAAYRKRLKEERAKERI